MSADPTMRRLRGEYHRRIAREVLRVNEDGVPNNADRGSETSKRIAAGILEEGKLRPVVGTLKGQEAGRLFETATSAYLEKAFALVTHLRPGSWVFSVGRNIRDFAQFRHLTRMRELLDRHSELRTILGDYIVKPDIVVARRPVPDEEVNRYRQLVEGDEVASGTPLRETNSSAPLLHASVSCKWTIRSDRSQNARTEALNLIRHRKGNTPHIVVVTAEPLPGRLASIALGTGDVDCVYHFALPEMRSAVTRDGTDSDAELLEALTKGDRLRDVSDLPFDLAI